ncbi:MAG: hypothetical protein CVV12_06365 [Gammaproteobacteria bacterium HGW-Gammaproteobacteria-2]|jgi:hypothetical protein|nr:MAG: hypothetical protein CVV12_06365 [Gammaproteobacteria bacterium HGW-Gammaproteobacteria-2]
MSVGSSSGQVDIHSQTHDVGGNPTRPIIQCLKTFNAMSIITDFQAAIPTGRQHFVRHVRDFHQSYKERLPDRRFGAE